MRAKEFISESIFVRAVPNKNTGMVDIILDGKVMDQVPFAPVKLVQAFAKNPEGLERVIRDSMNKQEVIQAVEKAKYNVRNAELEKLPISPVEQRYIDSDKIANKYLKAYVDGTLKQPELGQYLQAVRTYKDIDYNSVRASIKHKVSMKQNIDEADGSNTFYHCTLTKNVSRIQKSGILPMQTSNWVKAGDKERYGEGQIFAFETLHDAARWAGKWDWEISKNIGSGKVSVVSFKTDPKTWEQDTSDPLSQAGARGKWFKKHGHVPPKDIVDIIPMTNDAIRYNLKESVAHLFKKGGFLKWKNITSDEARAAGITPEHIQPAMLNQTYNKKVLGIRINGRPYLLTKLDEDASVSQAPTLHLDNPGGKWQEGEQSMSRESGTTEFGAPSRFGSVTASFSAPVNLPVDMLADVRGMRGEQKNVRHDDLAYLVNLMKTTGKLPDGSRPGREYAPFITIDYSGTPWVSEGNHRIMAAKKLGWNYLPTEVRYFAGGETVPGPWSPKALLAQDGQLQGKPRFKTA